MATILLLLVLQTQVTGSPVSRPPVTGSIAGVVRDTAGHPLVGAVVSIAGASRHVRTDSLGQYRFDGVPATSADVMAWAYGHKTVEIDTVVRRREVTHVDFVLHPLANSGLIPAGLIFGVVRDTAGNPVVGAVVSVNGRSGGVLTNSLGTYHVDAAASGVVHLLVRRIGYSAMRMDANLAPGTPLQVDLVLKVITYKLST